ncbi:MAG: hypothetical protein ACRDD7_13010 [Peptostreptococcaceae bacterium]
MKDLRCVSLHFFFKVTDSDMFGGKGSVGYAATSVEKCIGSPNRSIDEVVAAECFDKTCNSYRSLLSTQMNVPLDSIVPISRDECNECTEEDGE